MRAVDVTTVLCFDKKRTTPPPRHVPRGDVRCAPSAKEIKFALDIADEQPEGTILIISLKRKDCTVPDRLSGWQWVNYFEPTGYERLMRALRLRAESLETGAVSSPESAFPPMPEQTATEVHQQSGGVNVDASEVKVGNDVVERDKVESAGGPIIHAEPGSTVFVNERPTAESTAAVTALLQQFQRLFSAIGAKYGFHS